MFRYLLCLFLTAPVFAQNQVNLGGGCATPHMVSEGLTNNMGVIINQQLNTYVVGVTSVNSPSYISVISCGFTNPNVALPSCGCVLRNSIDFIIPPGCYFPGCTAFYGFPAGYSALVYLQRVTLAPACNEFSFGISLSDAVEVYLP